MLLEEIGGERLCFAEVNMMNPLKYTLVADPKQEAADEPRRKAADWIYLSPAIDVDRFCWRIGRIFGAEDVLRKAVTQKER